MDNWLVFFGFFGLCFAVSAWLLYEALKPPKPRMTAAQWRAIQASRRRVATFTKADQVQMLEDEIQTTFGVPLTLEEAGLDPNNPPANLDGIDMTAIYARWMDDEDA